MLFPLAIGEGWWLLAVEGWPCQRWQGQLSFSSSPWLEHRPGWLNFGLNRPQSALWTLAAPCNLAPELAESWERYPWFVCHLLKAGGYPHPPTSSFVFTIGVLHLGWEGARWVLNHKGVVKATYLGLSPHQPLPPTSGKTRAGLQCPSGAWALNRNTLERVKAGKSRDPQPNSGLSLNPRCDNQQCEQTCLLIGERGLECSQPTSLSWPPSAHQATLSTSAQSWVYSFWVPKFPHGPQVAVFPPNHGQNPEVSGIVA